MKKLMIATAITGLLALSAGASHAETTYVDQISVTNNYKQLNKIQIYAHSNNLSCGPKTVKIQYKETVTLAMSEICNSDKLKRLENNDVWVRIKASWYDWDKDTIKLTYHADKSCMNQHVKFRSDSGAVLPVSLTVDELKPDPVVQATCNL